MRPKGHISPPEGLVITNRLLSGPDCGRCFFLFLSLIFGYIADIQSKTFFNIKILPFLCAFLSLFCILFASLLKKLVNCAIGSARFLTPNETHPIATHEEILEGIGHVS